VPGALSRTGYPVPVSWYVVREPGSREPYHVPARGGGTRAGTGGWSVPGRVPGMRTGTGTVPTYVPVRNNVGSRFQVAGTGTYQSALPAGWGLSPLASQVDGGRGLVRPARPELSGGGIRTAVSVWMVSYPAAWRSWSAVASGSLETAVRPPESAVDGRVERLRGRRPRRAPGGSWGLSGELSDTPCQTGVSYARARA
jgi:hypothetical protein